MPYILRNAGTREDLATVPTLTAARRYCNDRLLSKSADRTAFLSDLAAGLIRVSDGHGGDLDRYPGPGF